MPVAVAQGALTIELQRQRAVLRGERHVHTVLTEHSQRSRTLEVILTGKGRAGPNGVLRRQPHVDRVARFQAGLRELVAILTIHVLEERAFLVKNTSRLTRDNDVS